MVARRSHDTPVTSGLSRGSASTPDERRRVERRFGRGDMEADGVQKRQCRERRRINGLAEKRDLFSAEMRAEIAVPRPTCILRAESPALTATWLLRALAKVTCPASTLARQLDRETTDLRAPPRRRSGPSHAAPGQCSSPPAIVAEPRPSPGWRRDLATLRPAQPPLKRDTTREHERRAIGIREPGRSNVLTHLENRCPTASHPCQGRLDSGSRPAAL